MARTRPAVPSGATRPRRASRAAATAAALALAAAVVLAAACGRGGEATATPTPPPTRTPTPTSVVTSPTTLRSYRYTIALTVSGGATPDVPTAAAGPTATASATPSTGNFTIQIDGEVVNPDREYSRTVASLGFIKLTVERIQIGDQAWTREAGGPWKSATPGTPASGGLAGNIDISPASLFAAHGATFATMSEQLQTLPSSADTVDGIASRRYDLDAQAFQQIFKGGGGLLPGDTRPETTTGSLWVGEDPRVPLRLRLQSTTPDGKPAFEMDMRLSDLNANLTIEPPA